LITSRENHNFIPQSPNLATKIMSESDSEQSPDNRNHVDSESEDEAGDSSYIYPASGASGSEQEESMDTQQSELGPYQFEHPIRHLAHDYQAVSSIGVEKEREMYSIAYDMLLRHIPLNWMVLQSVLLKLLGANPM
jgi:hypothetical protein